MIIFVITYLVSIYCFQIASQDDDLIYFHEPFIWRTITPILAIKRVNVCFLSNRFYVLFIIKFMSLLIHLFGIRFPNPTKTTRATTATTTIATTYLPDTSRNLISLVLFGYICYTLLVMILRSGWKNSLSWFSHTLRLKISPNGSCLWTIPVLLY